MEYQVIYLRWHIPGIRTRNSGYGRLASALLPAQAAQRQRSVLSFVSRKSISHC